LKKFKGVNMQATFFDEANGRMTSLENHQSKAAAVFKVCVHSLVSDM